MLTVLLLACPQVQFENPATLLHGDNLQVFIHGCHEMKDETKFMGTAVVTITEMIWAQAGYLTQPRA